MKEVVLADKAGYCFGVKRAVDSALRLREQHNKPIYTLGPLIHNNDVVNFLKDKEIYSVELDEIDKLQVDDVIIIRSHGVPKNVLDKLKNHKVVVENATCPYVSNIQQKVEKYYKEGYSIIIVGDKSHPEVVGINGWCNNSAIISKNGENLEEIPRRVCVVSQTTEKQSNWEKVLSKIIGSAKELIAFNTICSATEVRQKSAEEISKEVDAMIVIGGFNSSNTTKLYEICKNNCDNTYHVENLNGLPREILNNNKIKKIGVTAGASTPDWIIKEAIEKMKDEKVLNGEEMELYEQYSKDNVNISVGKILEGEVFKVNDKEAYLTIGTKSEAILPINEYTKEENASLKNFLKSGDRIRAKVINRKNTDGLVVLSTIEVERQKLYEDLRVAFENKEVIEVVVKEEVKGGLVASYKGIRVFIPASHLELNRVSNFKAYVGNTINVQLIEFERQRNGMKIVASRRDILKGEKETKEVETWNNLEEGQIVEGIVRRISNFGAFVEVNGVDGLLHSSEISWNKVNNPNELLKVGEKVKVSILTVDKENKKLSLSIKKLSENPWNNIKEKYPVGNIVLGKVVRFAKFGAFVELEPGVDGLVHISQISKNRIESPEEVLKVGEEIKAIIVDVNEEQKRVALSIKALEEI
ncbi:4-hydroxy-3-methylbut-2-enyl diphosphate reductase [Clostridium punense]|uniref:4-hydroxy-3-methylbut-2-enyl diphosphate reductase n=1 Tax=Clostridium punense TaxID=1054297 RepID=A0ABS4JYS8_9CLOT|nr:bifunctional 4-hydroxy-3-methylbut-2-enyl diphosphate reductase/30S ribosomal protein S1 [Clostridium punense]MBP2020688.1 4-hydroxy-3-methylbut-2-enyl diphosphate reductase [Clostridium punense]